MYRREQAQINYTPFFDNSMPADDAARDKMLENMKVPAKGGTLPGATAGK